MHSSDAPEHQPCAVCTGDLVPGIDRTYDIDGAQCLCFECATRLGGRWDEASARWLRAPDLRNVPTARGRT